MHSDHVNASSYGKRFTHDFEGNGGSLNRILPTQSSSLCPSSAPSTQLLPPTKLLVL